MRQYIQASTAASEAVAITNRMKSSSPAYVAEELSSVPCSMPPRSKKLPNRVDVSVFLEKRGGGQCSTSGVLVVHDNDGVLVLGRGRSR